jgi:hypothetical protein
MVRMEAHYLNATMAPIMGTGTIVLTGGVPGQSYQQIGMMFCGSVSALDNPGLPPNAMTALPVGFYGGGGDVDFTQMKVFAFTSHEHHRGTDVKVWKGTNAAPTASLLYDNPSWANPPLATYPDGQLLEFSAGEGLAWQCSYDTSGVSDTIHFGESAASDEMCFIWAYYYPSIGRFISQPDCWR